MDWMSQAWEDHCEQEQREAEAALHAKLLMLLKKRMLSMAADESYFPPLDGTRVHLRHHKLELPVPLKKVADQKSPLFEPVTEEDLTDLINDIRAEWGARNGEWDGTKMPPREMARQLLTRVKVVKTK